MTPIPNLASLVLALVLAPVASAHATFSAGASDQAATVYVTDTWGVVVETNGVPGPQPYGYYCDWWSEEGCYGDYSEECDCWTAPPDLSALPHVLSTCFAYNAAALTNACLVPSGGVIVHQPVDQSVVKYTLDAQRAYILSNTYVPYYTPGNVSADPAAALASIDVTGPAGGYVEATALCTTGLVCRVVLP